jgi:hypothetical protein
MPWAYLLAILTIVACLGYGLGLARLVRIAVNLGDAGILGLLCFAILGCAIHFFSALSLTVQMATLSVGIALAAILSRDLIRQCKQNPVAVFVGFSAFSHRQALTFYDTGLYHLQTFMWNSQFPITLGLGNLHGRLAFNSTLFLIAPLDDRAGLGWISNLAVLVFVLMSCYARLALVTRQSVAFWFLTLAVITLALWPQELFWAGVLNADGFAAILVVYWFSILICYGARQQADVVLLFLTAAFAVTVKLSTAPLMLLALGIVWINRKTADVRRYPAIAIVGMLFGLWVARGFLLSGCAVYPVPQTCIAGLPWSVSRAQAAYELLGIKSWARTPHRIDYDNVMGNWTWVPAWTVRTLEDWSARLLLVGAVAGSLSALFGTRVSRTVLAAAGALCICLAYWFFTAPDVRFGSGYLAAAGILGLSIACAAYFAHFQRGDFVHRLTIEAIVVSMLIGAAGLKKLGNTWTIKNFPAFVMMTAPGGKSIWVPQARLPDPRNETVDQCWDHQLPCTPYFHPEALERVRWR